MLSMYKYLKAAAFFLFLAFLLTLFFYWCGCQSSLDQHIKVHYGKDCNGYVLERSQRTMKVKVVCPGKDPIIKEYQNPD